ncbi:MAG: FAD-dependent oxidoreductase, partial [Epsilonproteobacteria bacterium]|nr:FAD-dependent oxidoreductase [Campylobacterota bacterium]
ELKKLTKLIKSNGALAGIHLNHAGRGANKMATKEDPLAPSPIPCPMSGLTPKELSIEQIESILEDYKSAVKKALEAGFDAIELQCGHGQLIQQFLSERLNKRDDIYGKDKTLFLKKVLEAFKGVDGVVKIARISGSEFVEGGWMPKDNRVIFDLIKDAGFDLVHCGFGNSCDTPPWYYSHMALPKDKPFEVLKAIKEMCDLPVIAVGRMGSVQNLKKLEDEGLADFVAFGRPLVADSNLVNKLVEKRYDEIDECGYCLQGCLYNVKKGVGLGCIINPEVDKEPLKTKKVSKKVAVIGSGPAGLSAAITFQRRGDEVSLFEKDSQIGGNFLAAPLAKGKESMKRPLDSLIKKAKRFVADIRTNVNIEEIDFGDYDKIVVANGSIQNIPDFKGLEDEYMVTSLEYFFSKKDIKGDRVLIVGAGMVGMEAAENLVFEGKEVVITKRGEEVANDMEPITKKLMMKRLEGKNIKIMTKTSIVSFEKEGVRYIQDGKEGILPRFDTVIIATGLKSDDSVAKYLDSKGFSYEVIGDAKEVRNIYEATKEGYEVALKY